MRISRQTALAALLLQSVLLFYHLGLLPLWDDELFTLTIVHQPLRQMLEMTRYDIHPPLYYLAQRYWLLLPLTHDPVVQLRMLSALFTLAGSVFALWFLLPKLSPSGGVWFAMLLATSPCLILYGRMARSYSLQILVVLVAVQQLLRLLEQPRDRARAVWFGLAAALVLYTHYAPGIAVALAASIILVWRTRSVWPAIPPNAVMIAAYLPWLSTSLFAVSRWLGTSSFPSVTGSAAAEEIIKLGYCGVSFLFGESIPWWLFLAEMPLALVLLWLAWQGWSRARDLGIVLLAIAVPAYVSVSRWVTYPFIPARMLYLLPFVLLLLVFGAERRPIAGRIVLGALLAVSAMGLWSYYRVESYLNWSYAVPFTQIARDIAPSQSTMVVVGLFTNARVLQYSVPGQSFRDLPPAEDPEQAADDLTNASWLRLCIVRNSHDTSKNGYYARVEAALMARFPKWAMHYYRPRTPLDNALLKAAGIDDTVPYFYQVMEFTR